MLQSQAVVLECVVSVMHVLRMSSFCYDHHAYLLLKPVAYINTTEGGSVQRMVLFMLCKCAYINLHVLAHTSGASLPWRSSYYQP